MSRLVTDKTTEENGLERFGLDPSTISGELTDYLRDSVTVIGASVNDLVYPGAMYNVHKLDINYHKDDDSNKTEKISFILKEYRGNSKARDFSRKDKLRTDLHQYEAVICRNMDDYVPRVLHSDDKYLIMEDLGKDTLETRLLEKPGSINNKTFEDLVARVAGFHSRLSEVNRRVFKDTTQSDYHGKFDLYIDEILKGVYGKKINLEAKKKEKLMKAFSEVAKIFEQGSVTGRINYNDSIHQDLHPPHVFYKARNGNGNNGDKKDKAFFIDFRPWDGPVQFDLVDLFNHPLVSYFTIEEDDEKIMKKYIAERLNADADLWGVTTRKRDVPDDALKEFAGMYHVARGFRDIKFASKPYSLENARPNLLNVYKWENPLYLNYRYWYLADAIASFEHIIDAGKKYGFDEKQIESFKTIHSVLEPLFRREIKKKDSLFSAVEEFHRSLK